MKFIRKTIRSILLIGILLVTLGLYAVYIEPQLLCTKEIILPQDQNIDPETSASETLTIVQFSDTHLGFHFNLQELQRAVEAMNALDPDLIFFTGDLIDIAREYDDIDAVAPIMAQLQATYGKYAVYGNHDYGGGAQRHYETILTDSGFQLLANDTVALPMGKQIVGISGLDEAFFGQPDPGRLGENFANYDYNILLMHEPDPIKTFSIMPNLVITGHSHGGQVRMPFFGPLITTTYAETYTEGLYTIGDGSQLYVNVGLGTTKLPMRFANLPELTVYKLTLPAP